MKRILLLCLFLQACATKAPEVVASKPEIEKTVQTVVKKGSLDEIATSSSCSKISWKDRGRMPIGFYRVYAKTYARSICYANRADVQTVSGPESGNTLKDVLSFYEIKTENRLRTVYTILAGLAARESSGHYCCGRDSSANFSEHTSAEAGTFQTSWGVSKVDESLPTMTKIYQKGGRKCFLEEARDGWNWRKYCSGWNEKNWNKPEEAGYQWQKTTKECPAFAMEYAAVVLRKNGGSKGEFGPIRQKKVEIRAECEDLLKKVEDFVKKNPKVCEEL